MTTVIKKQVGNEKYIEFSYSMGKRKFYQRKNHMHSYFTNVVMKVVRNEATIEHRLQIYKSMDRAHIWCFTLNQWLNSSLNRWLVKTYATATMTKWIKWNDLKWQRNGSKPKYRISMVWHAFHSIYGGDLIGK